MLNLNDKIPVGYFIHSENTNYYKMGVSSKCGIEKRLKALQTGNPNKLSAIHINELSCNFDMRDVYWEQFIGGSVLRVGRKYGIKRMCGEWIDFSHITTTTKLLQFVSLFSSCHFGYDNDLLTEYIQLILSNATNEYILLKTDEHIGEQNEYVQYLEELDCDNVSIKHKELTAAKNRLDGLLKIRSLFV